jgi:hypothetical protein
LRRTDMRYILSLIFCLIAASSWGFAPGFLSTATHMTAASAQTWTFVASSIATNDGNGMTLDGSTALDINDGDILIAAMRWESGDATCSFAATSGATNSFSGNIIATNKDSVKICVGQTLNASNNDTATIRGTLSSDELYRRLVVLQFRPAITGVAVSGGTPVVGSGAGTSIATSAYSSSGSVPLLFAFAGTYNSTTFSNQQIDGNAATGSGSVSSLASWWYRLGDSTSGAATVTSSASTDWAVGMMEIK